MVNKKEEENFSMAELLKQRAKKEEENNPQSISSKSPKKGKKGKYATKKVGGIKYMTLKDY